MLEATAEHGMVINQAVTISFPMFQLTIRYSSAEPTPIIPPTTTCVVETGAPVKVANRIEVPEDIMEFKL